MKYPSNPDAEKGLLSACIQWPEMIDELLLEGGASLFYQPNHKALWNALESMRQARIEIELPTIIVKLRDLDALDEVGGAGYLGDLAMDVASRAIANDLLASAKQALKRREIIQFCEQGIREAYDTSLSPDDVSQRIDTGIRSIFSQTSTAGLKPWVKVLNDFLVDLIDRYDSGSKTAGIPTGFKLIDEMTAGFHPGQMWVIGARPSVGKTAFTFQIAEQLAANQVPVAFFSAEMLATELATRSIAADAKLDSLKIKNGTLTKSDFPRIHNSINRRMHDQIYVDDRSNMRLIDIEVCTRRAVDEYGVKAVFVDYLQLIKCDDRGRNREDEVRRLSNGLKSLAKETGVTMVALAQLNRQNEEKNARPKAANLRDSGSIEQDADVIVLLHKESPDMVEAIVAKARGGKTGIVAFDFHGPTTTFRESDEQSKED